MKKPAAAAPPAAAPPAPAAAAPPAPRPVDDVPSKAGLSDLGDLLLKTKLGGGNSNICYFYPYLGK